MELPWAALMDHPFPAAAGRLRQRIARRYVVKETAFTFGGVVLPFTRVADPDRVLDEVAEEEDRLERVSGVRAPADQLHLPYWAELWDSAIGMGAWLVKRWGVGSGGWGVEESRGWEVGGSGSEKGSVTPSPSLPTPHSLPPTSRASVLDLGCGMGLVGTVAAALGARVLFADLESPALLFARLNALPWRDRVRTRRLNWQTDHLDERFDLILGADILYERKQWDFLEPFWRAHLAPGGAILLGEPGRQTGDLFIEWISSRGWTLTRHEQRVDTREKPIRLFELRLT
ncbi:MAG: methyltransferase [Tepidisphaeraceae bacterium]